MAEYLYSLSAKIVRRILRTVFPTRGQLSRPPVDTEVWLLSPPLGYWGRGSGGEDNNVGNIRVFVVKDKKSDFVIKTIQDLVHPPPFFSYN